MMLNFMPAGHADGRDANWRVVQTLNYKFHLNVESQLGWNSATISYYSTTIYWHGALAPELFHGPLTQRRPFQRSLPSLVFTMVQYVFTCSWFRSMRTRQPPEACSLSESSCASQFWGGAPQASPGPLPLPLPSFLLDLSRFNVIM